MFMPTMFASWHVPGLGIPQVLRTESNSDYFHQVSGTYTGPSYRYLVAFCYTVLSYLSVMVYFTFNLISLIHLSLHCPTFIFISIVKSIYIIFSINSKINVLWRANLHMSVELYSISMIKTLCYSSFLSNMSAGLWSRWGLLHRTGVILLRRHLLHQIVSYIWWSLSILCRWGQIELLFPLWELHRLASKSMYPSHCLQVRGLKSIPELLYSIFTFFRERFKQMSTLFCVYPWESFHL